MNIYEKLQKVRVELQNKNLKKSGENKFAKYKYYELSDFLPTVVELLNQNKLFSQINFNENEAELIIIDMEKPETSIKFTSPVVEAELKGCTLIQCLGATQTYIRRYLYTNALDIVESDVVDSQEPSKEIAKVNDSKVSNITDAQVKRLYTIAGLANKSTEDVKKWILTKWKKTSVADLTRKEYDELCKVLESQKVN